MRINHGIAQDLSAPERYAVLEPSRNLNPKIATVLAIAIVNSQRSPEIQTALRKAQFWWRDSHHFI